MTENSARPPEQAMPGEAAGRLCPKCGSGRLHRSHRRGALERMLCLTGGRIRRCHDCSDRFLCFGGSAVLVNDVGRAFRKAAWALAILAGALAVTVAMLWLARSRLFQPLSPESVLWILHA